MAFKLRSPAFGPGGEIPLRYTCDGSDVSPPLRWTDPPQSTKGFALIVADPDDVMGVCIIGSSMESPSPSASSLRVSPARAQWLTGPGRLPHLPDRRVSEALRASSAAARPLRPRARIKAKSSPGLMSGTLNKSVSLVGGGRCQN